MSKDWRTPDVLTERIVTIVRSGKTFEVSNHCYDAGRRQQFIVNAGGVQSRTCDHYLGVFGHMQRLLRGVA